MNPFLQKELDKFEQFVVARETKKFQEQIADLSKKMAKERWKFLVVTSASFIMTLMSSCNEPDNGVLDKSTTYWLLIIYVENDGSSKLQIWLKLFI